MYQPTELRSTKPLRWSTGRGVDVWAMFVESMAGNLPAVQQLVATDPSLVRSHYGYRTSLYFAVKNNRIDVADFLLQQSADPLAMEFGDPFVVQATDRGFDAMATLLREFMANRFAVSPLGDRSAELIRAGDEAGLLDLLETHPEALHAGDRRSNQPIHWAVMTRQIPIVQLLHRRGADLNARRQDGAQPIHLFNGDYHYRGWRDVPKTCATTQSEILDCMLRLGATCDLNTACHRGDRATVLEILRRDPNAANRLSQCVTYYLGSGSPLRNAAATGNVEILQILLDHGADPNLPEEGIAPDGHALYTAVSHRHLDAAKLLLEHGAIANPEVESSADALSRAIDHKDQPMIDLLCRYGAARRAHLLGYYGDLPTAAAVFAANPELARDPEALANAAGEGHEAFIRLMLRYHPQLPSEVSFPGWLACGKTASINELLFAHGMDPNHADWMGATSLHHIAARGNVDMAQQFIDRGADLHVRDDDLESTPLAWAAKAGQEEMVKLLLAHGAMAVDPADPPWATPLAWANRRSHPSIARMLTTGN
jgi:ankyrin repeat protein